MYYTCIAVLSRTYKGASADYTISSREKQSTIVHVQRTVGNCT
jgi:hypothetical protein